LNLKIKKYSQLKLFIDLEFSSTQPHNFFLIKTCLPSFLSEQPFYHFLFPGYSNNFMANQLILAMGANKKGSPATLAKGVKILETFSRGKLGLTQLTLAEGSGISRRMIGWLNLSPFTGESQTFHGFRFFEKKHKNDLYMAHNTAIRSI
jgi:hypothetical protein